jgi:hypothetical protein
VTRKYGGPIMSVPVILSLVDVVTYDQGTLRLPLNVVRLSLVSTQSPHQAFPCRHRQIRSV